MLLTQGGRFAGFGLYLADGKLVYHYNLAGVERFTIESDGPIPTGDVVAARPSTRPTPTSRSPAPTVTLFANDKQIGKGRVEKSIPNRVTLDETLDIGFDTGTPVSDAYEVPNAFSGKLKGVTIRLD